MKGLLLFFAIGLSLVAVSSVSAQSTLALQEKCAEGAKRWLEDHDSKGIYGHSSHYNRRLDKCFIRVNYLFLPEESTAVGLEDAFEWRSIGSFFQTKDGTLISCSVGSNKCSSRTEFEALIKPYMEE